VSEFGSIDHLNSLIIAGANLNIQNNEGKTALFYGNSCLKTLHVSFNKFNSM
jgi:hypothetical protein